MNKMLKICVASLSLAVSATATAGVELKTDSYEGAVGWTPVAVSLASPVQLPWGIGNWDVFGLDFGIFYNDVAKMYGLGFALANTARDTTRGVVLGGVFNYCDADVYAIRAALGLNLCNRTLYGLDLGGFGYHRVIYGGDIELVGTMQQQLCGFTAGLVFNATEFESCGCTIAGGVNLAQTAYGAQIAGVCNMTDELHGCQIGLVNFAKACPWGFQVGLINIIMDNQVKVLPIVNGYF